MRNLLGMGMLELGKTRRQKWQIVGLLALLQIVSIAGIIGIFLVVRSAQLPPVWAVLLIIATVTWLFTFVLLFVTIAYLFLKRG